MKYIVLCFVLLCNLTFAQATCDTLLQNKVNEIYHRSPDLIDSLKIVELQKVIDYSLPSDNSCNELLGTMLVMQGNLYKRLGLYPVSEKRYKQALIIRNNLFKTGVVDNYNGVASIYSNLTHWAELQEKYSLAIRYANKVIDTIHVEYPISDNLLAKAYINRAGAYRGIRAFDKAQADYDAAKKLLPTDNRNNSLILRGLSDVARVQKDCATAIDYAEQAIVLYRSLGMENNVVITSNFIGSCYFDQGKIADAQKQYEQSLNLATEIANPSLQMDALINLMRLHADKGEIERAKDYEERLEKIVKREIGSTSDSLSMFRTLTNVYERNQEYEKALNHSETAFILNNSIRNQKEQKNITEIKATLESEKQKERLQKWLVLAALLLTLGAFVMYQQRQKIVAKTKEAKEREETLTRELETYKKQQTIGYLKKDRERAKKDVGNLATDLHDEKTRIAAIKRDLEYTVNNVDSPDVLKVLDNAIEISNTVFYNLRKISLALHGSFDWSKQMLEDIEQLKRAASIEVESKNFNIDETIPDEVGEELSKVFSVLLDNIYQHAEATKVSVDFARSENELIVLVEDNGNGFDPKTVTYNVGLRSVIDRVEKTLNGKLDIDAAIGRGAIFIITIPV